MSDLGDALKHSPLKSPATAEVREQQLFAQMGKPRLLKAIDKFFLEHGISTRPRFPNPPRDWRQGAAMKKIMAEAIRVGCDWRSTSGQITRVATSSFDRGEKKSTPRPSSLRMRLCPLPPIFSWFGRSHSIHRRRH